MSVAFTEAAVRDRTKTVTRRKGWLFLKPGDRLTLCRKVMGRKGAPLVRIAEVEVVDVRREPLRRLTEEDWDGFPTQYALEEVAAEGFPRMRPEEFVDQFFIRAQKLYPDRDIVTRIEWRYLDDEATR